ncbi:DMT family protein [Bosea sp. BK604]|uniref:DMT family protein n=1 Tax=Bosea sp. BK604 TaxID=2512180 RepID=UPI0010521112|nr:DMT family protein [Bosea sp. BK604]TCR69788.1 hypothetical protein EV560_101186 [Bosea sp. BK604]
MQISSTTYLLPIVMLFASNIFMTFAWYGHLSYKGTAILLAIFASWMIALPEYMLAVPANRIGSAVYSAAELKTMQEIITLIVFAGFSVLWLKQPLGWNHAIGFALIAAGAFFIFQAKA